MAGAFIQAPNQESGVPQQQDSQRLGLMMRALNWAYDRAAATIPGLGSAEDLAATHLRRAGNDPERAIAAIVAWHVAYAGTAGFVSNIGGPVTLPVAIPANLSSVLLIQLRMIAAIAHLRGYSLNDPAVRTLSFVCLTGSSSAALLQDIGMRLGTRLTTRMVMRVSDQMLARINRAVGFRLVGKASAAGLVNLSRLVPLVGGVVGGGFDAALTRAIAGAAKHVFHPLPEKAAAEAES